MTKIDLFLGASRTMLIALVLTGCSVRPMTKVEVSTIVEPSVPPATPLPPVSDGHAAPTDAAVPFWEELADARAYPDCDYAAGVQSWVRRVVGHPQTFSSEMARLAPWIDYVWREAKFQDMPAEVALLPLVESGYRPVIGGFGAPGGWWQLMPGTAKAFGLKVQSGVDQRMDPIAGTLAALTLLSRLREQFEGNWLLALIGYNVGPLNVERWLKRGGLQHADVLRVEQMPTPRITLQHMHRLIAFGCVIADPERYGVVLPELTEASRLHRISLERDVPPAAVAAALGDAFGPEWQRQNPQLFARRVIPSGVSILATSDLHERIKALGELTRFERAPTVSARVALASTPSSGKGSAAAKRPVTYAIRSGDSLWLIARRHDMRVKELIALNEGLRKNSVLKLGRKLRLR